MTQNNLVYGFRLSGTPAEPAGLTLRRLSTSSSALLHHQRDWRHAISKTHVWGHVMATGACPEIAQRQAGGTPGSSIWSPGFSRTHTACGAAGLAGRTSVLRCAGRLDEHTRKPQRQAAKWTSCTRERPSGICGLISQSDSTRSWLWDLFFFLTPPLQSRYLFSILPNSVKIKPHPIKFHVY